MRFNAANIERAKELIGHYPRAKSATIPLCHLAQEQDGYLTEDAMEHIAELVGVTPAEVYGTASFYEMFKFHPVGKYLVGVCTNISCMILGGEELLEHCEEKLGVRAGATTADGLFTLEEMECLAACTRAPCLQVNYRYFENVSHSQADTLIDDLRAGKRSGDIPPHGTLARVRQSIPADRRAFEGHVLDMPQTTKMISARWDQADGYTLAGYERTGGYSALRKAMSMGPDTIANEVKTATLLGRGGAGFPCGVKWSFLPPNVHPRYLVVNGDESEPGTFKDRLLMELDPHQLIEGVLICSYAIQAKQAFLYIRGEMAFAQERVATALNEAYAAGYIGKNILGSDWSLDVVLHWGAGAYIVGEETGLIESLEGDRGMPRLKPPFFPASKGLYLQPTVVNNVETLSNLPWIVNNGASAFLGVGDEKAPGTRLFALSGHVRRPGVYEVDFGTTTFRELFEDPSLGGGIRDGRSVKAFIPGGASAPWFFEEHLDMALHPGPVGAAGSMLGSGAIVVMDDTTDMVKAAWRLVKFFGKESCGKCSPCREGTSWLEKIYRRILDGHGRPEDIDLLLDVADNISPGLAWPPRQTTICPLGPSAASPLASSIRRFRHEYEAYVGVSPQHGAAAPVGASA